MNHSFLSKTATCIVSLMLLALAVSRILYPFDVGHFEACTWTPGWLSVQGANPYAYATREPFVMAPYGYGYYLLVGLGLRLFGWQLQFGRTIGVISTAVCVLCLAHMAYRLTRDRLAMWLGVLTFLSTITLFHWLAVHRPDLPALALAAIALMLVFDEKDSPNRFGLRTIAIIVLLTSAFFFKQTMVLPIGIAIFRYVQTAQWRQALGVLCGVIALGATIAFWLNATSDGAYFWQHVTLMRQVPADYNRALHWLGSLGRSLATWIGLGMIAMAIFRCRLFRDEMTRLQSPVLTLLAYLIGASGLAFVTSARAGSYISYYLEASFVFALLVALAWQQLAIQNQPRRFVLTSLIGLLLFGASIECLRMTRAEIYRWGSLPYYREIVTTLRREIPSDRLVFSIHPELAVASGHSYHFGDWMQYNDGRAVELQQLFVEQIASRRYGAVIWLTPDDVRLKGYRRIEMRTPPGKHYPVYLFLADAP